MALDADGSLHVVDTGNARVVVFDEGGNLLRTYGGLGDGMVRPHSVAIDMNGRAVVADPAAGSVFLYDRGRLAEAWRPLRANGFAMAPTNARILPDGTLHVVFTD